jgi:multidrug efflux pump subunit AcrA (membrane-fusion protein)
MPMPSQAFGGNRLEWRRARFAQITPPLCLIYVVLTGSSLLLFDIAACAQAPAGPLPAVSVVTVRLEDVARNDEFIGRIEAIQQVDVRARVQGFLQKVAFTEGQDVKADDPLFEIEPDQYEAALLQVKAQQASAEASLHNAQLTLERRQALYIREAGTELISIRRSLIATPPPPQLSLPRQLYARPSLI